MAGTPVRRARRMAAGEAKPTGTRPPFPEGHTLAVRHGALTKRIYSPVAAQLATELLDDRPDLERFPEAVAAWAEAEAQAILLRRHNAEHGLFTDGETTAAAKLAERVEARALKLRERLGLDPRAEADLAKARAATVTLTVGLEQIAQRGAEALAARDQTADLHPLAQGDDIAGQALAAVTAQGRELWDRANVEHAEYERAEAERAAAEAADREDNTP